MTVGSGSRAGSSGPGAATASSEGGAVLDPSLLPPAVCVLGLGLIGGSVLRSAGAHTEVFGWSPTERTRGLAAADGHAVVDELDAALERARSTDALTVLAGPLTTFESVLRRVDAVAPTLALTDVGSVKAPVEALVAEHAPHARFVGSHPMAGTAESGWAAGSATLLHGARWVTTLTEDTDLAVWAAVTQLALGMGCVVVPAEAEAHDAAVARVSHLPHLLALALAQVGASGGQAPAALALSLAASSFRDGTRVAGTRPELIRAMCEGNREALLDALDDALGILGVARGSLASTGSLAKLVAAGHEGREHLDHRTDGLGRVLLRGDDLVDQLLAIGAAGGHVDGLRRDPDAAGSGSGQPIGLQVSGWFPED
ncbi:prephenate dehydrogenase [Nakamurella leprariae]|uniref:Prephenate dehydrogenase n=1 Tax=Nakamurella leprariae TaxID=2803911 RepID=A0A938Y8V2_9ACTN|nr:prephenate dehydrogenase [Nakamurella leprariae]MBM9467970.1 prephenate dehydrogenase [Nakamurella leprariae]